MQKWEPYCQNGHDTSTSPPNTQQMTKWKGAVHGYGGGREQLSEDSATVQLSLVDVDSQPIPVNNSREDFIMYIPRSEETSAEPTLVGADREW